MAKRFRGEGKVKLDDKGRVLLPASLREPLEGDGGRIPTDPKPELIIVYGDEAQRHLEVYTAESMEDLYDKIDRLEEGDTRQEAEERYFGQTLKVEVDGTGRILIQKPLREKLGVEAEVYVIGLNNRFEIWDKDEYDANRARLRAAAGDVPKGAALREAIDRQLRAQGTA